LDEKMNENEKYQKYGILPYCISGYEKSNKVCDGCDEDEEDEPCDQRDTCIALSMRIETKKTFKRGYVNTVFDNSKNPYCIPKNILKFGAIIDYMKKRYEIKDGKSKDIYPEENYKKSKEAKLKKVKSRHKNNFILDMWYDRWISYLIEHIDREFCENINKVKPNQLFVRDRRKNSSYVTLNYKKNSGLSKPIAKIEYKPRDKLMNVYYTVPVDDIFEIVGKEISNRLSLHDCFSDKHSSFSSVSKGLIESGVMFSANAIVKLINAGRIEILT
jgi:hypothetical protein